MLNVIALILSSPEDERTMDVTLAVDILRSFARAHYPLPLLINEVRRILLNNSGETLKAPLALSALESFSKLNSLDGELLGLLVPHVVAQSKGSSAPGSLAQICGAAAWANAARRALESIGEELSPSKENREDESTTEIRPVTGVWMSGMEAQKAIIDALEESFRHSRLERLQVVPHAKPPSAEGHGFDFRSQGTPQSPLCMVPSSQTGLPPALVKGDLLLAGTQLLAKASKHQSAQLSAELLQSAIGSSKTALWPPQELLLWLEIAILIAETPPEAGHAEVVVLILQSMSSQAANLTTSAPSLANALPRILESYGAPVRSAVAELTQLLCESIPPQLYRLSLQDTYRVLEGSLKVQALLGESLEASDLLTASTLKSLPMKFKSEAVFHRSNTGPRTSGPELAEWCSLLATLEDVPEALLSRVVFVLVKPFYSSFLLCKNFYTYFLEVHSFIFKSWLIYRPPTGSVNRGFGLSYLPKAFWRRPTRPRNRSGSCWPRRAPRPWPPRGSGRSRGPRRPSGSCGRS